MKKTQVPTMQNQSFTIQIINTHTDMPKSFQNHILIAVILIQIVSNLHVCQPRSVSRSMTSATATSTNANSHIFLLDVGSLLYPSINHRCFKMVVNASISPGMAPVPAVRQNTNCLRQRYREYICMPVRLGYSDGHVSGVCLYCFIFIVQCTAMLILTSAFPSFQF